LVSYLIGAETSFLYDFIIKRILSLSHKSYLKFKKI
jgi:hypothetical protein